MRQFQRVAHLIIILAQFLIVSPSHSHVVCALQGSCGPLLAGLAFPCFISTRESPLHKIEETSHQADPQPERRRGRAEVPVRPDSPAESSASQLHSPIPYFPVVPHGPSPK